MKYVFVTPSGSSHVVDCRRKDLTRHAQIWALRWNESVDAYRCLSVVKEVYPVFDIDRRLEPTERKRRAEIVKTRCRLESAIKKFNALPKRGSFSGMFLSGEIDRLQKHLDNLGDKSKRFYPEVSIEVG